MDLNLDLLFSPGLIEMDVDWGSTSSDTDFYAEHAPALAAWLSDDGFLTQGVGEGDADAGPSRWSACPNIILNGHIVNNASEYSSVLKVSDIASALHNFSRAGTGSSSADDLQKSLPMQNYSSVPPSPSSQDLTSNAVLHSGVNAHTMNHSSCMRTLSESDGSKPSLSFDMRAIMSHSSCLNATLGLDIARPVGQSGEIGSGSLHAGDGFQATERESSNKVRNELKASKIIELSSSDDRRCENFDVQNDGIDTDDEIEHAEDGDLKPSVSHVRIIRRPNSNCGQGMMLAPKSMKFTHMRVEAASSCQMASSLDDKQEGGNLKQMRKDSMSPREAHILSERQRRKSMCESFSILQSLLPKLNLRHIDRITVLTEVVAYIRTLHGTLEELERKKADILELLGISAEIKSHPRHHATITYVNTNNNSSSHDKAEISSGRCTLQNGELVAMVEVTVRMYGADIFMTLSTPRHKGVWSGLLSLLHKFSIEISNATLASSRGSSFHCIHGKATNMSDIEGVDLQGKLEDMIVRKLRRHTKK